ncbi:MAG TPA: glutamate--tRNA ligase [Candidatus Ventricola gallistercoris]|nr:glutamate--tRNA ligase [Candidatus Ventricola gallistercoris]
MSSQVRTRFAPSPTGYLHLGGLRTALYTYLLARKHGGRFILRIEDTDQEREVPGAVDLIYKSMRQAGLDYDEGPDVGGEYGPYIQTQRRDLYPKYAWELVEKGGAYCCFCTKEEIDEQRKAAEARGETYKYNKKCLHTVSLEEAKRRIAAGEPYVIRQNVPESGKASFDDMLYGHVEVDCETLDDNVLIKADGLPTYNFANVIDDHLMAITHVTRGTEYLSSAPKYNLLYEAFGWKPPVYLHLPPVMIESVLMDKTTRKPILDEQGNEQPIVRKLSKRYGDPSFEDLLAQGYLKEAIVNYIALLGWAPKGTNEEFFTLEELCKVFDENGINKSPAIFDMGKLTWFNAEYIRCMTPQAYADMAKPWLTKVLDPQRFDLDRLCELLQARTETFAQLPGMVDFLAQMPPLDLSLFTNKKSKSTPETSRTALAFVRPILEGLPEWTEAALHDAVMEAIPQSGMKNATVLWPLRIAITGRAATPGGAFEMAYLLGREETMKRLDAAMQAL